MRTILTLLLAVAWMPLSVHCQIESITGFSALQCSSSEQGAPVGNSHCDGDLCCAWESGHYTLPSGQPTVPPPLLALLPLVPVLPPLPAESQLLPETAVEHHSPPPKPWQVSQRAALPVRAPSLAS
jgi:hypothetical protein